jgi:hypothetical protein
MKYEVSVKQSKEKLQQIKENHIKGHLKKFKQNKWKLDRQNSFLYFP